MENFSLDKILIVSLFLLAKQTLHDKLHLNEQEYVTVILDKKKARVRNVYLHVVSTRENKTERLTLFNRSRSIALGLSKQNRTEHFIV